MHSITAHDLINSHFAGSHRQIPAATFQPFFSQAATLKPLSAFHPRTHIQTHRQSTRNPLPPSLRFFVSTGSNPCLCSQSRCTRYPHSRLPTFHHIVSLLACSPYSPSSIIPCTVSFPLLHLSLPPPSLTHSLTTTPEMIGAREDVRSGVLYYQVVKESVRHSIL
jgi:hypothetical protein